MGTISTSGLYTAPSTPPGSAVTVAAASTLATGASGSIAVTVVPVTVAVSGPASLTYNSTGQYSATVTGAAQGVTWLVNGVAGGIDRAGHDLVWRPVLHAPASTPPTPVIISAQSTAVSTSSGSISITIAATTLSYATGDTRTVTQPSYPAICATVLRNTLCRNAHRLPRPHQTTLPASRRRLPPAPARTPGLRSNWPSPAPTTHSIQPS